MPRVHVTFLTAHAVPPEFFGRRHDCVDAVSLWCADAAAPLARDRFRRP
jgi:imidazolonepropionase